MDTQDFLDWNKQFEDGLDLDTRLPEQGISLREFRLKIYQAEQQEGMSKEAFFQKMREWK